VINFPAAFTHYVLPSPLKSSMEMSIAGASKRDSALALRVVARAQESGFRIQDSGFRIQDSVLGKVAGFRAEACTPDSLDLALD
jgi:hypothetical protein